MEENITGGVSPLQWKGRRGKSSGKGRRGTGDTRYKRDKWQKPASGGTTTIPRKMGQLPPPPQKPYTIDKDGKVVMNDPFATKKWHEGTPGSTTTEKIEKSRSTYRESYDAMEDRGGQKYNPRNKKLYDNFLQYEAEAIQWNKDNPDYKEYETKTVTKKGTPGHWKYYDENGGEISKEEYSKYKNKK